MKLYVGTYHKYNCGSIAGNWLNLDDYENKSEFLKACKKVHKDEQDAEYMFQDNDYEEDWENEFYSEYGISQTYWDVKNELKRTGLEQSVFSAWCQLHSLKPTEESVTECLEKYRGIFDTLEDYVQEYYEESGQLENVPQEFRNFINFAQMAHEWDLSGAVHIFNGYVFDN